MAVDPARLADVGLAAVLGPIFGSFVTALTYRLPRGQSIAAGRSRCPACAQPLGPADLVPILSWVASRGRCRHCGAAISARYPIIESLSLAAFVVSAAALADPWRLLPVMGLVPLALALAVIDFEHQRLPNALIALLIPIAAVWRWRTGDPAAGAIAAILTYAALSALDQLFIWRRREPGLGGGDTKLITLAAFMLTPFPFFVFLFVGSAAGLGLGVWWRRRTGDSRFPFGVTLLFALWFCLVTPLGGRWP